MWRSSVGFPLLVLDSSSCWFHSPCSGKDGQYQPQEVQLGVDSLKIGKSLSLPVSLRRVSGKALTGPVWVTCPTVVQSPIDQSALCVCLPLTPTPRLRWDVWSLRVGWTSSDFSKGRGVGHKHACSRGSLTRVRSSFHLPCHFLINSWLTTPG